MTRGKTGTFFALLNGIVDGAALAALSKSELKVLMVFLRHSDALLVSYPGPQLIAEKTGIGVRKVYAAIAGLKAKGLLENVDPDAAIAGRSCIAKRRLLIPKACPNPARLPLE